MQFLKDIYLNTVKQIFVFCMLYSRKNCQKIIITLFEFSFPFQKFSVITSFSVTKILDTIKMYNVILRGKKIISLYCIYYQYNLCSQLK